ncbi:MAG: hypothetical protein R2865_10325 [Deinococcales bacterium]
MPVNCLELKSILGQTVKQNLELSLSPTLQHWRLFKSYLNYHVGEIKSLGHSHRTCQKVIPAAIL